MQVVCVQLDIVWEDRQANFDKISGLLYAAALESGALVVLPEVATSGFSFDVATIGEGAAKLTESFMSQQAAKHDIYLLGGVVNQSGSGRGLNQAVVFGPDGQEVTRYTKLHPFSFANETDHYDAGDAVVSFPWCGLTVTPLICYDLRFPEVFRHAVRRGSEVFVVIANFPSLRVDHWLALIKARAIENQAYVVAVNRCGSDPEHAYPGRSMVVDPRGEVLGDAGSGEGLICVDVDADALGEYRRDFPALRDMRGDL
jgi:omega-amidase